MDRLKRHSNKIILPKDIYYLIDNKATERTDFVDRKDKWELKINILSEGQNIFIDNERFIMNCENTKKCDWLLFNDSDIYFIEAKDVQISKRNKERKDAKLKFRDTLNFYKANFDISNGYNLNAVLNFRNNREITAASSKENKAYYKEKLGLNYEEQNVLVIN